MALTSFLIKEGSTLANEIASNLYVDNIMMQAETPKEALQKYRESKKLLNRLWVFADASNIAMATCAYLQCKLTSEVTPLISGKTRLTPKKIKQTIPRLELVAILMATRLCNNIRLNEIALCWIKSCKKLPVFVENQRKKIVEIKTKLESDGISIDFFHLLLLTIQQMQELED
ncbi:hypothetical protein OSTOST_05029 [Ostertagia ostertagi]